MTTKAKVFEELVLKVLGIECTLEPIGSDDRDVHGESSESKSQAESEGSMDK
jgi:hypothetical protein